MRIARTATKWAAIAIGLVLGLLIASYTAAQTEWGKRQVVALIANVLSDQNRHVSISRLNGRVPDQIGIERLDVSDGTGTWLVIEGLRLDWRPLALVRGRLEVAAVAARRIAMTRCPPCDDDAEPGLQIPPAIRVGLIDFPLIALGEQVLGIPAEIRVDGQLSAEEGEPVQAELLIERLDAPNDSLRLAGIYDRATRALDLEAELSEAPGGLTARLLGLPDLPALEIALFGEGPLDDWWGVLDANLGDGTQLSTTLNVDAAVKRSLKAGGTGRLGDMLPTAFRPLLAPAFEIELEGHWDPAAAALEIRTAAARNAVSRIEAAGEIDLKTRRIRASAEARVEFAGALAPLIAPGRARTIAVSTRVDGPLQAPDAVIAVTLDHPTLGTVSARKGTATVQATPRNGGGYSFQGKAQLDGFATTIPAADRILGPSPALAMNGYVASGMQRLNFSALRIEGAAASGTANGWVAVDGTNAEFDTTLEFPSMSHFSETLGLTISGAGTLSGRLQLEDEVFSGDLALHLDELSTDKPLLSGLLGPTPSLTARVLYGGSTALAVREAEVVAGNGTIRATGRIETDFEAVTGDYAVRFDPSAPVFAALGLVAANGAELEGAVGGPLINPSTTARLSVEALDLPRVPMRALSLSAEIADLAKQPHGSLSAEAIAPFGTARASGQFAITDRELIATDLRLDLSGAQATGALSIPYDRRAIGGELHMKATALASLTGGLGAQVVSGQASASMRFTESDGEQVAIVRIEGHDLSVEPNGVSPVHVATLTAEATVSDPFDTPLLRANVEIRDGHHGDLRVEQAGLSLNGTLADARFRSTLTGDIGGATRLKLEGTIRRGDDSLALSLASLDGQLAGHEVVLREPVSIQKATDEWTLSHILISYGQATLEGRATLSTTGVAANLDVRSAPLALAERWWPGLSTSGSVDATLRVSGSPDQPSAVVELFGSDIAVSSHPSLPRQALRLSGRSTLSEGRLSLQVDLAADDAQQASASVTGSLPFDISLVDRWSVNVPSNEAIEGTILVRGRFGLIERLVSFDPHSLTGRFEIETAVAGTLAEPRLTGTAAIHDGRYENLVLGTVLNAVNADMQFSDRRATIRGSATDGQSGSVAIDGNIVLGPSPAVSLVATLRDTVVIRRDDITGLLSGDIRLSGWPGRLELVGETEASLVEVRLTNELPPEVVRLDIIEIRDGRTAQVSEAEATARANKSSLGEIDLGIRIPRRLFVRGRGLDSEWAGDLRVIGPIESPRLEGRLEARRGTFSLIGKTFKLRNGALDIAQREGKLTVSLDVETAYEGRDFTAIARITGPASNPEIMLSSTPELPRDEILSRILFGRGSGRLSPLEALQLADAAAALSGRGSRAGDILEKARAILGIDVLQVEAGDGAGPAVRAGRYISDGIFIGTKQEAGPAGASATVEIEVTPNITIESEAGQSGQSGVGVKWKFDY